MCVCVCGSRGQTVNMVEVEASGIVKSLQLCVTNFYNLFKKRKSQPMLSVRIHQNETAYVEQEDCQEKNIDLKLFLTTVFGNTIILKVLSEHMKRSSPVCGFTRTLPGGIPEASNGNT